jgi:hypothetical protein
MDALRNRLTRSEPSGNVPHTSLKEDAMGIVRRVTKGRDGLGREVELFSKDLNNRGVIVLPALQRSERDTKGGKKPAASVLSFKSLRRGTSYENS